VARRGRRRPRNARLGMGRRQCRPDRQRENEDGRPSATAVWACARSKASGRLLGRRTPSVQTAAGLLFEVLPVCRVHVGARSRSRRHLLAACVPRLPRAGHGRDPPAASSSIAFCTAR
jgi:hypothetical protein